MFIYPVADWTPNSVSIIPYGSQVLFGASRVPADLGGGITTILSGNNGVGSLNAALYRLILIKEQLNAQQLEFLKWKVDKEYRDWIKKNNYNINL